MSFKDWYKNLFSDVKVYEKAGCPTIYATTDGRMHYESKDFFESEVIQNQIKKMNESELVKRLNSKDC